MEKQTNIEFLINPAERAAALAVASEKAQKGQKADKSAKKQNRDQIFNILFFLLVQAMDIGQESVYNKSLQLESNAALQQRLNKEDKQYVYKQAPGNATQQQDNQVQEENERIAAMRANVQNELVTARQKAQVTMTGANSDVDYVQQDASMDSGWLNTLMSVFQVINRISQPS